MRKTLLILIPVTLLLAGQVTAIDLNSSRALQYYGAANTDGNLDFQVNTDGTVDVYGNLDMKGNTISSGGTGVAITSDTANNYMALTDIGGSGDLLRWQNAGDPVKLVNADLDANKNRLKGVGSVSYKTENVNGQAYESFDGATIDAENDVVGDWGEWDNVQNNGDIQIVSGYQGNAVEFNSHINFVSPDLNANGQLDKYAWKGGRVYLSAWVKAFMDTDEKARIRFSNDGGSTWQTLERVEQPYSSNNHGTGWKRVSMDITPLIVQGNSHKAEFDLITGGPGDQLHVDNVQLIHAPSRGRWTGNQKVNGVSCLGGSVGIGTDNPTAALDVDGQIDASSNKITGLSDPTNAQDAATKSYVDNNASGGTQNLSEVLAAGNVANQTIEFSNGIEIGDSSTTVGSNTDAVAVGNGADASGLDASAFGSDASASGSAASAFGGFASATNDYALAVGYVADATGYQASAVGFRASASGDYASAFGRSADATAEGAVAIGHAANAPNSYEATFGNLGNQPIGGPLDVNVTGNATVHGSLSVGGTECPDDEGLLGDGTCGSIGSSAEKDLTTSGGLTGGQNDVLAGTDGDVDLSIASQGVSQSELNTNIAGTGLSGGGGNALSVNWADADDLDSNGDLLTDAVQNGELVNNQVTVSSGNHLSGGGNVFLGGSTTLNVQDDFLLNSGDTMNGDLNMSGNRVVEANREWVNLSTESGWSPAAGNVSYAISSVGEVHLRGTVTSGSSPGTKVLELPERAEPAHERQVPVYAKDEEYNNDFVCRIVVTTGGAVRFGETDSCWSRNDLKLYLGPVEWETR